MPDSPGRALLHRTPIAPAGDAMVAVETIHAIYAKLENRPGSLERATRVIREKRLNIDSISVETNGGWGFLRVLTPKSHEVVDALHAGGFEAYQSDAVVASIPNKTGELTRASAELAAAGLNIESVFSTADGRLAFRTNDNERAAQILRKI